MNDDECIMDMLASNRGHYENHEVSLINNEDFCLAARAYVRSHACRKGEPNLTIRMFSDWIEAEYNTKVHESSARRWL